MPEQEGHQGRTIYERVGALEQDMAVVKSDQVRFERVHEHSPNRLTKLEQQFEFQTKQLSSISESQDEMSDKVDKLGGKIAYGLGAAAVILALFDKVWPLITKGIGV
jgi:hypothetical protein